MIWWNIFKHEQDKFIKACQLILVYPRRKARTNPQYIKADRLKHLTVQQEIELAESRHNPMHLYRHETYFLSHDTVENRFLKHALVCITQKHNQLAGHVLYLNISDSARSEIYETKKTLCNLCNHPFFRSIGKFTGLSQESFILQRASGYSTVARVYAVLKAAYALKDGLYHLETKDIATLYEIWCFISMKNIVSKLCDKETNIIHCNRSELNQCFSYNLNTGEQSRILFKKGDIELAELLYNPKTTTIQANGIKHTVTPTGVAQQPDIVLQLTKHFGNDDAFKLTYLFDAKYRIADHLDGVDIPPDDSINQMHRYRDAIYYKEPEKHFLRKEVIGGYILFPGTGASIEVQEMAFYKSIEIVNIGAFPLRPGDDENKRLLECFVSRLLQETGERHIQRTIPQKGTFLQLDTEDAVRQTTLYGTIHGRPQIEWMTKKCIYNLPVDEAALQGITTEDHAKTKHWLVLIPAVRSLDRKTRIYRILSCHGYFSANEFNQRFTYYHNPSHPAYWVWQLAPIYENENMIESH